jgi:hypothetical protein
MESYNGVLQDKLDALYLIEAARRDLIPQIYQRFSIFERQRYIRPGCVFIWNERKSKIKRWTDGRKWSASRVIGTFLSYKEMKPPKKKTHGCHIIEEMDDGLLKQSFSYNIGEDKYHIVSYIDTKNQSLQRPSRDSRFSTLQVEDLDSDDLQPVYSIRQKRRWSDSSDSSESSTSSENEENRNNENIITVVNNNNNNNTGYISVKKLCV